jgi:glycosyltransferase involved in cell wall biosynthesis
LTFKIVSTGWHCAQFLDWTLASIEAQVGADYDVMVVVDPSEDDTASKVARWCSAHGWRYRLNTEYRGVVRNQYEAIMDLDPADDDVIVWVDLDGDRLADPHVLARLTKVYSEPDVLVAYGSYRSEPDKGTSGMASEYPPGVIGPGLRKWTLQNGPRWNHLRSMSGRVFRVIPKDQFHWISGPRAGRFYARGSDYIFMTAALELAGEKRYRFMPEVNLIYNHANELADNLTDPDETNRCVVDFMRRPALEPLP